MARRPLIRMDKPTENKRTAMAEREARATRLAGLNRGVISRSELYALGFTRDTVLNRIGRGVAHDLGGDVVAWGHLMLPARGWHHAALLSMGPDSAISFDSAAFLHGLIDDAPGQIHVSLPRGQQRVPCRGVVQHRVRALPADDIALVDGVRVTTPVRTLFDKAPRADDVALRQMIEVVLTRHKVSAAHLLERAVAAKRVPGITRTRDFVASMTAPRALRSKLERRFRAAWERAGHPPYLANQMVAGLEVDILFPGRRLIIELDIYQWHGSESRYRNDRKRGRILELAGYHVFHLSGEDFDADPETILAEIAAIVARYPELV